MRNEVVRVRLFQLFVLRICRPQAAEFAVNQSEWPGVAPRPILCGLVGTFMRSLPLSGHWALMSAVHTGGRQRHIPPQGWNQPQLEGGTEAMLSD